MLTDSQLRKVKTLPKAYRMADGRGLYLVVTPSGSKLWRYKYRYLGREKLMALGQYPDVPLASARQRHAEARKLLADGTDPMAARKAQRLASAIADRKSFRSVGDAWLDHWKVGKSERHVNTNKSRLKTNIYPHLGARPIGEIEAPELVAMVKAIESRGVGDLARRTLETTGQIFRYAIAHGYCSRNPAADIKPRDVLKAVPVTNLARIEASELGSLMKEIEVYQGKTVTRLAVKLMAHVWVRTKELIGGEWAEVDWEARRWTIPGERMKMRTPHIVPLSTQAIGILRLLHAITGNGPKMFPGDTYSADTMSNNTILSALERMGFGGKMTGHGFRGLASTILYENGFEEGPVEMQLAHKKRNKVRAAYDHAKYLQPRTEMMQWWSNYLDAKLQEALK